MDNQNKPEFYDDGLFFESAGFGYAAAPDWLRAEGTMPTLAPGQFAGIGNFVAECDAFPVAYGIFRYEFRAGMDDASAIVFDRIVDSRFYPTPDFSAMVAETVFSENLKGIYSK